MSRVRKTNCGVKTINDVRSGQLQQLQIKRGGKRNEDLKEVRVEQLKFDVQIFTHSYFGASARETIKLCFSKAKAAQGPLLDVTCTAGAAPGHVTSHVDTVSAHFVKITWVRICFAS